MASKDSDKSLKGNNKLVFYKPVTSNSHSSSWTNNSWSLNIKLYFYNRLNQRPNNSLNINSVSNNLNTPSITKYAVLVGINYIGSSYSLNGCINDMNNINKYLLNKKYKQSNIKLLSDDSNNLPTKKNILDSLRYMLNKAKSGDQCFFSYSGHGFQTSNIDGSEIDGRDECLLSCKLEKIADDELKSVINNNLKKGVKLFCLMDCCHSGTILDLRYNYKYTTLNRDFFENKKETIPQGDVIMISGCMDKQYSMDAYIKNTYQGAMTNSFLENISKSKNWSALVSNMRNTLYRGDFIQVPQLSSGRVIKLDSQVVI